ncbi:MAG: acyl-CoA dehydrogenase, partial [Armatimonadetes bacterium CG07_land_8_20_14_0_80_40_9]
TTLYQLLWMIEQGIDWIKAHKSEFAMKASAAKLYSSEMATQCALDAIQIHGGYGYMKEYHMERFMRDAKLMEIGAGTSEIQQLIIARELIK